MLRWHHGFVLGLLVPLLAGAALYAQADSIEFGGIQRTYLLHVPQNIQTPIPLVIALHGGGGTAANFENETDFDSVADQNGFIVVYPQGVNNEWNEDRGSGMTLRRSDADDVGYINALIDRLATQYAIDLSRVYVMGISNGGFMSLRLACNLSDRLAGIGIISAQFSPDMLASCVPIKSLRVAIMNGTTDPIVPYDGGSVTVSGQYRGDVLSTQDQVDFWLRSNQCDGVATDSQTLNRRPLDGTTVVITDYSLCASGGAVRLYRIEGGGHAVPGGSQYLPRAVIGNVSREFHAPTELWAFWSGN